MLSEHEIEENRKRFMDLIESINRDGMDMEMLRKQLLRSDFFYAPASANYHGAYRGGLCEHSLHVYDNLVELAKTFCPTIGADTIKIVALLHDFSKMNYFKEEIKNKKVYSENGSKSDSMGRFDWVSVRGYTAKDVSERFLIGSMEENSVYMVNTFIPLTAEEFCAILHFRGGDGEDSSKVGVTNCWIKYPLSLLLHQADCIATFIQEANE